MLFTGNIAGSAAKKIEIPNMEGGNVADWQPQNPGQWLSVLPGEGPIKAVVGRNAPGLRPKTTHSNGLKKKGKTYTPRINVIH